MHHLTRRLAAIALAAFLAVFLVPAPASAAGPVPAASIDEITGEPWSAPAHPVVCIGTPGQATCHPTNATERVETKCFLDVRTAGGLMTVCTTYAGNAAAISNASTGERQADGEQVGYGCLPLDVLCLASEGYGKAMAAASMVLMGAVMHATVFDTNGILWDAAAEQWSFWAWAVLGVMLIALIWGIASAAVQGRKDDIVGVLIRTMVAVFAIPTSLWLIGQLINLTNDLSDYVLYRGEGARGLFTDLQRAMYGGGVGSYWWMNLILTLVLVAVLMLLIVFSFRNIALAALAMIGPVAFMLLPAGRIGIQWVIAYWSAVCTLLLTGPLTLGFIKLVVDGMGRLESVWDVQAFPLLIGLALVAFAPMAVFGLFSFAGGAIADSVGQGAGRNALNAARSARRALPKSGGPPAPRVGQARRNPPGGKSTANPSSGNPSASKPSAGKPGGGGPAPSRNPSAAPKTNAPSNPGTSQPTSQPSATPGPQRSGGSPSSTSSSSTPQPPRRSNS